MKKKDLGILCAMITLAAILLTCNAKADLSEGLPLPSIPNTLVTPEERAAYAIAHFWDEMDFADDTYSLDTTFMEQAFSNYAAIMSKAPKGDSLQASVDDLYDKASVNDKAIDFISIIAEKYLYEPESPVYDEVLYTYFIKAQLKNPHIADVVKQKLQYQLDMAMLNRPGSIINDFAFTTREGGYCNLMDAIGGKHSIIIFYDPECEDCHEVIEKIRRDSWFDTGIAEGKFNIIAISRNGTYDEWMSTKNEMPASWIVGYDSTDIEDNNLYEILITPTLFLVSPEGRVMLKGRPFYEVVEMLYNNV